ncbi:MAG: hypothetical protein KDC46_00865 [Thermoleophilia bacterium]|nr:hypothetical protein [Thermoleophilia bacterium]
MRIGRLDIEVRRKGRRRVVRADLTVPTRQAPIRVRGSLLHAVETATSLTRRDHRSWAVLQAERGVYELVPLTLMGSDELPETDALGALTRAPGVAQVSVTRLTGRLVAIAGESSSHVFTGEVVSLSDPA